MGVKYKSTLSLCSPLFKKYFRELGLSPIFVGSPETNMGPLNNYIEAIHFNENKKSQENIKFISGNHCKEDAKVLEYSAVLTVSTLPKRNYLLYGLKTFSIDNSVDVLAIESMKLPWKFSSKEEHSTLYLFSKDGVVNEVLSMVLNLYMQGHGVVSRKKTGQDAKFNFIKNPIKGCLVVNHKEDSKHVDRIINLFNGMPKMSMQNKRALT